MSFQKRPNLAILCLLAIVGIVVVLSGHGTSNRAPLNGVGTGTAEGGRHSAAAMPGAASGVPLADRVSGQTAPNVGARVESVAEVGHAVSAPLRDMKIEEPAKASIENESQDLLRGRTVLNLKPQPAEAYNVQTTNPLAMPTPLITFEGLGNRNGAIPPDSDGAVGPNNFVEWINTSIQVFDKSGNSLYGPINGNQLFANLPSTSLCRSRNQGDPIVLYDELAGRWLLSQFAFPDRNQAYPTEQCIAISQTGDPAGAYYLYDFQVDAGKTADYPHFGIWPDGYYMTANLFTPGGSWAGDVQVVFDRAQMLLGHPATMQVHHLGTEDWGGMLPSDFDGTIPPPAGSPNYFVEVTDDLWGAGYADELQFYRYHVDWANPANSTFTGPIHLPVQPFNSFACSDVDYGDCIPQPGTSAKLADLYDRLMWRLAYRNLGDHESLVVNHTVAADGANTGHTGIRWYELRNPQTNPTIYQQGTYAPDANSRWVGSAAMDRNGNLAIGFSESSSTMFPSIFYAGRLAADPLGQLAQGEAQMFPGNGSQTYPHPYARWGDYTELSVDPTDDCTFWYINEYYPATSSGAWHTRIGSFKFPSCSAATPTPTVTRVPTHTSTPRPTGTPPTATPTATPCAVSLSDVHPTDFFYTPIRYLYCMGAISGYADNTFRPYNNTTRAQLSKIIVLAEGWQVQNPASGHFSDVPRGSAFYTYVETAYAHRIISGYSDGTFRPNANVTRGQLSKIIVGAEGWLLDLGGAPHFTDVDPHSPFYNYVETAYNYGVISGYSDNTFHPNANATRGQISKIVYLAITHAN